MSGEVMVAPDLDKAISTVELWNYNPKFVNSTDTDTQAGNGELKRSQLVDKLSLYLSMKDDPDERVQGELKKMMESVLW